MIYFCQKGKKMGVTEFVLERTYTPQNTLNLKNRASFASKATASVSRKLLQLDLWIEMLCAKHCLSGYIKWI